VPFGGVREATQPKLSAGTETPSLADQSQPGHDLERAIRKGGARLRFDTRRGLQPKAKVETLPSHFEGKVPDLTGVIELALPCAGLCDHAGRHGIGLRTETDQPVGPLVDTTIVVHQTERAVMAGAVGRVAPDATVAIPLNLAGQPAPDPLTA